MGMSINRNFGFGSRKTLTENQRLKERTFARLSSGLRINSAKDDAAGLSISMRLTSNFRGIDTAVRNASDGISMVQTAEGALGQVTENLQRMRELAVQASNGTLTRSDRDSIQKEMSQLTEQIEAVSENTTFNGRNLLNGSGGGTTLQIGPDAGDTLQINALDARPDRLGQSAEATAQSTGIGLTTGDLSINGVEIRATSSRDDGLSTANQDSSARAIARAINDASDLTGVTAQAETTRVNGGEVIGGELSAANSLEINGVTIAGINVEAGDGGDALINSINAAAEDTGVVASRNDNGQLSLSATDGRNISISVTGNADQITGFSSGTTSADVQLTSSEAFDVGGNDPSVVSLNAGTQGPGSSSSIANVDVTTVDGANTAIEQIDRALESVSSQRSRLGATQNRLESTISNLNVASENAQNASGRISDADFAQEAAELIRQRILERSNIAMRSQANISQKAALQLLNG